MIELINKTTGTTMWVADSRLEEYLAAGHKLAAEKSVPTEKEEKPKRRTARK